MARAKVRWDKHRQVCCADRRRYRLVRTFLSAQCHSHLSVFDVCRDYIDRHKVVIVCSARSGSTKAMGTTNLLLQASSKALHRNDVATPAVTPGYTTPVTNGHVAFSRFPSKSSSPSRSESEHESRSRSPSSTGSSTFSLLGFTSMSRQRTLSFSGVVDTILSEHVAAARSSIQDSVILKHLRQNLNLIVTH